MDIDKFGEIMDKFIEEANIAMLITMPEGTTEATLEDSCKLGPAVQLYILLNAIPSAVKSMVKIVGEMDAKATARTIAALVRDDIRVAVAEANAALKAEPKEEKQCSTNPND